MGLFRKIKTAAPAAPRIAITDRVPSTPKNGSLTNYLSTSGGGYDALYGGDGTVAGSQMSPEDQQVWLEMRKNVAKAFQLLNVAHYKDQQPACLGHLVRDPKDPWAIWLEVNGVRVDRLMRSAVEVWEGGPAEPYPVLCRLAVMGSQPQYYKPSVMIQRNKT